MGKRVPVPWAVLVAMLVLASCAGADAAPTPGELAQSLLTVDDLGPGWQMEYSGPLTDEQRADPGGIDMCPEAASLVAPITAGRPSSGDWQADWQGALASLDWQVAAFTLPVDRGDAEPASLFQALVTGDPDEIEAIYTALSEGYRLCLSIPPPPDDTASAAELALHDVGSERFGWVLRMGEEDRWDIRWIILRDGPVLMNIAENEIFSGTNILSDQEIIGIVDAAAGKIP